MSHGAVVAREYGLPAIVGVTGVTDFVESGVIVTLDGNKGVLHKTPTPQQGKPEPTASQQPERVEVIMSPREGNSGLCQSEQARQSDLQGEEFLEDSKTTHPMSPANKSSIKSAQKPGDTAPIIGCEA